MSNKEQFEREIQFVTHRKGFKLVDPHLTGASPASAAEGCTEDQPGCPLRFEGKALLGKTVVIYVPKKYCIDGAISRERLAEEGFCGFAERSKDLYDCRMIIKSNTLDQWRIEVMD